MSKIVIRLPYVVRQYVKGREYFYFRKGKHYVRLPHPTDARFQTRYDRALKAAGAQDKFTVDRPGSFGEMVSRYLKSPEHTNCATTTKYERRRLLDDMRKDWGDLPASKISRAAVLMYRDAMADKPRTANYAMQTLRRVFNFGIDRGLVERNPAARPGRLKEGDGHAPWTDDHIRAFREKNAATDPMMVLALDIGLYTAQRLGDVIAMTRHDIDGQLIAVTQQKTKEKVWIPLHSALRAALDAMPKTFMLLTTKRGQKFGKSYFGHRFHAAVLRAGLSGLSFHGLRHTASNNLAEAGCTDSEIAAITGHKSAAMLGRYTRSRDKKAQAVSAIAKLENRKV